MRPRPWILPLVVALLARGAMSHALHAQTDPGWMRYPAISPDGRTIVFVYRGDLYRVPAAGGEATSVTAHPAHDVMPVWSHDGKALAFASDRHGNFDLYVMPAAGGEARRLTFHSAPEYPYAFTPDDQAVVFGASRMDAAANRLYPTASQPELYQVPAAGGRPIQVLTTPAEAVTWSRDGRWMLYQDKKGGENSWRKHHTSAIARDIWRYDPATGAHRKLTTFSGEDREPVLAPGDSVFYYLSEESGSFNVHRMAVGGGASEQVTRFTGPPVRFLTITAAGTLCFGVDGKIYTMAPGGAPEPVRVTLAADRRDNNERIVPVTGGAQEMAVSPAGKEVAFIVRGDVFVASVDGGVTKQITRTPEAEAGVMFSPDGKALLYASERGGRWAIYEARRRRPAEPYFYASTLIDETPVVVNERQNTQPIYSPDGTEIAYIEDLNTLRVFTRATGRTRTLLTDRHLFATRPSQHVAWSPDGRWLLFDYAVPGVAPGEVGLVRADGTGSPVNLTQSGFDDGSATWILGGKAMLWRSNRDGLKALAQSGGGQADVYAMFFTQDAWDRFRLSKEEFALVKESEAEQAKARAKEDSIAKAKGGGARDTVAIDLRDVDQRKARLTIHSSSLGDALVSRDGETLYYLARFEQGMNLWSTNLRTRETKMLVPLNANGGSLAWDKEQKTIFLLADGGLAKIDPTTGKREPIAIRGEMEVAEDRERAYLFEHVWRRTRDTYYTAGYHGADWIGLRAIYEKHLPDISNHYEFAELLSEMLGELNVSHSGASYTRSDPEGDATASLGILTDPTYRGPGVPIVEVLANGPLDRAGMQVAAGAVIESIDGETITADQDYHRWLNRKADRNVLLVIRDGTATRDVVVKPITLAAEARLLYTRWVRRNQREVDSLSHGRLGYIHVPGMNDGAYRTTFEEVMGKYATREGIVVDTRFNGGGDLVADLAMFLSGKRFFDYTTDQRSAGFEPNFRWTKPSVSLANEANYSDGHCYAWTVKQLGLGPLVGMPTPGTCTFAGWESLQDGLRWGVPGLGVKDVVTGRYLENWQTEPDILVRNDPEIASRGRDQQLETAVEALLRLLPAGAGR